MNEEFITKALQEDRYLKAIQLIDRFETELRRELELIGKEIVEENRHLFVDNGAPDWRNARSSSSVIAFARVDFLMDRIESADDDPRNLKLNISFRWVEPEELGHRDVDGALSLLSYKIKRADDEDFELVRERTREGDWPIRFADDAFGNAPGIAYIPVETAQELREAGETIRAHFSEFGPTYGNATDEGA